MAEHNNHLKPLPA